MNQLSTTEILKSAANYKFHLLNKSELANIRIGHESQWNDEVWAFDVKSVNGNITINWALDINGWVNLTTPEYSVLLDSLKRLVWSLFTDRREGRLLKPSTINRVKHGIKRLIPWMVSNHIMTFDMLTPDVTDSFLEDLVSSILEEVSDDEVTEGKVGAPIWLIAQIWKQSEVLAEVIPVPSIDPLRGKTANSLEIELSTKARGWIPPVPDAVSLPILTVALKYLSEDNETIVTLINSLMELEHQLNLQEAGESAFVTKKNQLIKEGIDSLPKTYRERFDLFLPSCKAGENTVLNEFPRTHILRHIVQDIAAACLIIIQSTTGIRSSELCYLSGEINQKSGLPKCISKRRSKSGLLDIYYIESILTKTVDSPERLEWVIGCALPNDDKNLPIAVTAIITLQKLFSPWREKSNRHDLWFEFRTQRGLPLDIKYLSPPSTSINTRRLKDFVWRLVDLQSLPDLDKEGVDLVPYKESRGSILRPHQWRKTFAIWLYRYDSGLIAAISEQFKHLSLAMTEEGYLGNDPLLLETLDSTRTQETVSFFFEASTGQRKLTGGASKRIEQYIDEIRQLTSNYPPEEARRNIEAWIKTNDIRIYFAEHGKCLMSLTPKDSKCNQLTGKHTWATLSPDYRHRSPDLCSGCDCFVVDSDHSSFWLDRYVENSQTWLTAENLGIKRDYKIAHTRAVQSKQILKNLGKEIPLVNLELN